MEFKVEHGVPIPRALKGAGSRKYPINLLEKGDSFFVPKMKSTLGMGGVIGYYRKSHRAAKFTSRAMKGGVRVWRVK